MPVTCMTPPALCLQIYIGRSPRIDAGGARGGFNLPDSCATLPDVFLQINARKIHGECNVFTGILDNKFFLVIMGMEFFMQFLMVEVRNIGP